MELRDAYTRNGVKTGVVLITEPPERMRDYYETIGFLRNGDGQV